MRSVASPALLVAAVSLGACDSGITSPPYDPVLPTSWAAAVTNPLFPLAPDTRWEYRSETDDGTETNVVEVLAAPRVVNGVTAVAVHDRVYLDGDLVEDTYDWYAQDEAGNVWYLGEDSKELENGRVVGAAGSWEWGVNGALPGVIMWADPSAHVGEDYRQEFYKGQAEDWAKVVATNTTITVPAGTFTNCVRTEDWNGLERGGRELKTYCPGLGLGLEVVKDHPDERNELILVRR